jgi:methionine aminopeptidase
MGFKSMPRDGKQSAHFEHTIAMTKDGPWALTAGPDIGPGDVPGPR